MIARNFEDPINEFKDLGTFTLIIFKKNVQLLVYLGHGSILISQKRSKIQKIKVGVVFKRSLDI